MENPEIAEEFFKLHAAQELAEGGVVVPVSDVFVWDKWQEEVLAYDGNITIRAGRQVGKSVVVAEKAARFALAHGNTVTLVIAASQRQSGLLFQKIKNTLELLEGDVLEETPTLTRLVLKNGSRIYSLPAGKTGIFIKGHTVDLLIVDEASYVSERVWTSVIPMIAVSKKTRGFGWIILLSTPFGKGGYFYNSFTDEDFKSWHVSSEDCWRIPKSLLLKERKRLSKAEYAQEWQGEFTEEITQFFKTELLREAAVVGEWDKSMKLEGSGFYLGVDVARYGGDENAFIIVELVGTNDQTRLKVVNAVTTQRVSTVDTIGRVVELDKEFSFKKVFIDDAGVGGGVTDVLESKLGRRVVGLNNASKRLEVQGEEKKRGILKEDLYSNVLVLLEAKHLELLDDKDLVRSMQSISYNYGENGKVRIGGVYSHLCEALVRACWCTRERGLEIYCF